MKWRLAKSLDMLRAQVNTAHPNRSRDSDGSIGDAAHASRGSDHNPWIEDREGPNVVSAIDITHDPAGGFDSYAFAEMLRQKKDPRIKYVISNGRIFSGMQQDRPAWVWRPYLGSNPHDHHIHISVRQDKILYDDTTLWDIGGHLKFVDPAIKHPLAPPRTLRKGATGSDVRLLQQALGITADGEFGPATEQSVRLFQIEHKLPVDGIVGPMTHKLIAGGKA